MTHRTSRSLGRWALSAAVAGVLSLGLGQPAAQADEVKLGFMLGFTGDYAPWSPALNNAAIVAIEEINANGGILGNEVSMIVSDNESKVEGGIAAARKLVNVDKVPVIIGPESDIIVALQDMAKNNEIPVVTSSAGTDAIDKTGGTGKFIWRVNASDSFLGVAAAKVLIDELGHKEIAIMVENLEGTQSAAASLKRNFERFGGKVTKEIVLTPGQATYLSELRDLADSDPKLVFLAAAQVTGVNVMKQAYQRGYEWPWWVAQELQQQDFVNAAGVEVVKGVTSWTPGQMDDDPAWQRFSNIFKEKWGEAAQSGFYQAETYDAFMVTALAMIKGGEATGAAVDANMAAVAAPPGERVTNFADAVKLIKEGKEINYDGPSGTIDFNEWGNVGIPAVRLMQVDDSGQWITKQVIDARSFPAS
ncbi:MAG: ABC transporter substrate-binding protein [Rhizobiales bacterium]|nr:ABC transporter substrate-binding protein [Hyphomicrobiales bacterium]